MVTSTEDDNRGKLHQKTEETMCANLRYLFQKGLEVCYCLWGVPSRPPPGSYPGPGQVPSRVRGGPVQIRHVLCFTVFRTHPSPEVGAIPARPGAILLPSVPYRIGPGRAETDFLATSDSSPTTGTFQFHNFFSFAQGIWHKNITSLNGLKDGEIYQGALKVTELK